MELVCSVWPTCFIATLLTQQTIAITEPWGKSLQHRPVAALYLCYLGLLHNVYFSNTDSLPLRFIFKHICRIFAMSSLPEMCRFSSSVNKTLLDVTYRILLFFSYLHAERRNFYIMQSISGSTSSCQVTHISHQSQTVRVCFLSRFCESWGGIASVLTRMLYFLVQRQCFLFVKMQMMFSGCTRCIFI